MNEALLFSNTGEIEVLPALPSEWKSGSIRGLMTKAALKKYNECPMDVQLQRFTVPYITIRKPLRRKGFLMFSFSRRIYVFEGYRDVVDDSLTGIA